MKEWYKTTGYLIFILSCILWGMILIVPFLGVTRGQMAGITTGLIIAGEITFYLSIFILGKSFYAKIKSKLKFRRRKAENDKSEGGVEGDGTKEQL
jgi:hypothetical protein